MRNLSFKPSARQSAISRGVRLRAAFCCCAKPTEPRRLAGCFADYRSQERVEHPVRRLVRPAAVVLGYEDLNDHDKLRDDSLLALAGDDLTGENRGRDRGHPLAPEPA